MAVADPPTVHTDDASRAQRARPVSPQPRSFLQWLSAVFGRGHADPPPRDAPLPSAPGASGWADLAGSVAHAIDAFVGAAYSLAAVHRVAARSRGPHVDFLVTVDGPWHEAIADLEPRLRQLRIEGTTSFDYTVVPAEWGEQDPPGYVAVFAR